MSISNWPILKWFRKKKPVTFRSSKPLNITIAEWQSNKQLVEAMKKISEQPVWWAFTDMLRNSSPAVVFSFEMGATNVDRAAFQAKIEGYQLALNNIEAACAFPVPEISPSESTFDPEEH